MYAVGYPVMRLQFLGSILSPVATWYWASYNIWFRIVEPGMLVEVCDPGHYFWILADLFGHCV